MLIDTILDLTKQGYEIHTSASWSTNELIVRLSKNIFKEEISVEGRISIELLSRSLKVNADLYITNFLRDLDKEWRHKYEAKWVGDKED